MATVTTSALGLPLRPYQEGALAAIQTEDRRMKHGVPRQLVVLPTGAGKTVIFAHLIAQQARYIPDARALILVHRDELVQQTLAKLEAIAPELEVGVVKAERNYHDANVVVASVQTLRRPNRLEQMAWQSPRDAHWSEWHDPDCREPSYFHTLIVDEAHHATAPSYRRILDRLRWGCCVGFTATPERGDKVGLGQVWDQIV
jgi:superfamily II DNA or RNA helicase